MRKVGIVKLIKKLKQKRKLLRIRKRIRKIKKIYRIKIIKKKLIKIRLLKRLVKRRRKLKLAKYRYKLWLRKKARRKRIKRSVPKKAIPGIQQNPMSLLPKGVNLIGFTRAVIGLGESGRLAAKSLQTTDIPYGIMNFPVNVLNKIEDMTWAHKEIEKPIYRTNLFHMNADYIEHAKDFFGDEMFLNHVNIGYWHWELLNMREEDVPGFKLVHEVWVPTTFVQESISKRATVPVFKIPHGIEVEIDPTITREKFGLPDNRYLFFVMYDAQSHTERKNPQAVIAAFKLAFTANDPNVGLVIKINNTNASPEILLALYESIAGYENIYLIDSALSRIEVNSLLNCADTYVSLHRAEGFGLGLAEAMYLGKSVIGTNWSGNTDFMSADNSCPVNYSMVAITKTWGPYNEGELWAEPEVTHAAEYMIRLVIDPEWRNRIAYSGQQTIRNEFSPAISGLRMKQRLHSLGLI